MSLINKIKLFFNKDKYIKCFVMSESGKLKEYLVKDEGKTEININGKGYTYSQDDVFYLNGVATLFFLNNHAKPYNFKETKAPEITAEEFDTALNNNVVKELMNSTSENKNQEIILGLIIACILGIIVIGYFTNEILTLVTNNQETIKTISENLSEILQRVR